MLSEEPVFIDPSPQDNFSTEPVVNDEIFVRKVELADWALHNGKGASHLVFPLSSGSQKLPTSAHTPALRQNHPSILHFS